MKQLLALPFPFPRGPTDSPSDSQELKEIHGQHARGLWKGSGAPAGTGAEEGRTMLQARLGS